MGKSARRLLAAAALAMGGSADPAHADEGADREHWGWDAFGGIHSFSDDGQLGSGKASTISRAIVGGLRIWQRLGDLTRVEAELPLGVTTSEDQIATLFVTMPRLHGRLQIFADSLVSPSVVLGGGAPIVTSTKQSSVASDIQYGAYAGAGLDIRLDGLELGLEGRYLAVPASGDRLVAHEWEVLLNVGFRKSARKEQAPAPPADLDRDGVSDIDDACPDRKEDLDGFEDEDGCPELDNDKDGVIDGLDECQGEAETHNGYRDDDGCPDQVTDDVRLVEGVISGLRFEASAGVMDADGFAALDDLAALLKAQPSVKLNIYGHTDDREVPAEELEALGQERADSVRSYLVEKGVGHGRLHSFSRADSEPFADNATFGGRRANRRVEIQLLQDGDEQAPAPAPAPP